ncbi:MAG: phosphoribosylformylglycinamidine synthase subunit PurS [Thermostichales cyanobacterium SZTDM-1c_bins_54]
MVAYLAHVEIHLKPSVLDPAGVAVQKGLQQLGHGVEQVRIGKSIRLYLNARDAAAARQEVEAMCAELLVNPVIETFTVTIEPGEL